MNSCNICLGEKLILKSDENSDQLLDHIAEMHLPAYCHKCLQVFLSRADLTRTDRCNGHDLAKHKALDCINKPTAIKNNADCNKIGNSPKEAVESNNNAPLFKEVDAAVQKFEIDSISDALEKTASVCSHIKESGITTSTPMAPGFNTMKSSPIGSPQVSDIASPNSDMELTQVSGVNNEARELKQNDKKPGILVKGGKSSFKKQTPRVKFAASPVKDRSSISKKRLIKYTPRREFITNPRFQEILRGFEANKFGPQPPLKYVTANDCPDSNKKIVKTMQEINKYHKPKSEKMVIKALCEESEHQRDKNQKECKETIVKEIVKCNNCKHTSAIKIKETQVHVKEFAGTPSYSSECGGTVNSNDFTPHGIGQFGINPARTALSKKFAHFKESPDICESDPGSNADETSPSTTGWFTPMSTIVSSDMSFKKKKDVDNDDSPLEVKASNSVFCDDPDECQETEKSKSSGIWSSVTGVVKNAICNIGLVLTTRPLADFKRSHSVSFDQSGVSPRPILKRSKSGDASSPRFLYSKTARGAHLPLRLKARKPLRKHL